MGILSLHQGKCYFFRSVAHYNLEDGSILESTSNPLWVSCLYIKANVIFFRSVAHYNLEDGSILESTSNPLWVFCLYIKANVIFLGLLPITT